MKVKHKIHLASQHEVRSLLGVADSNIRKIGSELNVQVVARDQTISLAGAAADVSNATMVLDELLTIVRSGSAIELGDVDRLLDAHLNGGLGRSGLGGAGRPMFDPPTRVDAGPYGGLQEADEDDGPHGGYDRNGPGGQAGREAAEEEDERSGRFQPEARDGRHGRAGRPGRDGRGPGGFDRGQGIERRGAESRGGQGGARGLGGMSGPGDRGYRGGRGSR
ncbi:MAG: hypothetical protein ACREJ2_18050, partial [Planctomycetota bacterium]